MIPPLLAYETPDPVLGNRTTYITVEDAIQSAKHAALKRGYFYDHSSDALLDFVTVHWAWFVEPLKVQRI